MNDLYLPPRSIKLSRGTHSPNPSILTDDQVKLQLRRCLGGFHRRRQSATCIYDRIVCSLIVALFSVEAGIILEERHRTQVLPRSHIHNKVTQLTIYTSFSKANRYSRALWEEKKGGAQNK